MFTIALVALLLVTMAALASRFGLLQTAEGKGRLAYGMVWAVIVAALIARSWGPGFWGRVKKSLVWFGIFMVIITGYSFRAELGMVKDRVMLNLLPNRGLAVSPGAMVFQAAEDGHFYIQARVNGTPVLFLADTGATQVVLAPHDAKRAGFAMDSLGFNGLAGTANGLVRVAAIRMDRLDVGGMQLTDFPASVNEVSMETSLLGMSFFSRLESYQVKNGMLTINWSARP